MKKTFAVLALTVFGFAAAGFFGCADSTAHAADMFDMFTEEHVKLYEEEIAGKKIVSNLSQKQLQKTADKHNISIDKLKKVLIFQDAVKTLGANYSVEQILNMRSSEIFRCAKNYIDWLKKNKSEEEFEAISEHFKNLSAGG